ncbi:hypothetical protein GYMLUDRAFT_550275 [Collybiopsis luxurians FD-317 M1]|nr:hypothetical protein GYMLUDRAFT_550275 [Collybiopsis luxurians FD-317 M1]
MVQTQVCESSHIQAALGTVIISIKQDVFANLVIVFKHDLRHCGPSQILPGSISKPVECRQLEVGYLKRQLLSEYDVLPFILRELSFLGSECTGNGNLIVIGDENW